MLDTVVLKVQSSSDGGDGTFSRVGERLFMPKAPIRASHKETSQGSKSHHNFSKLLQFCEARDNQSTVAFTSHTKSRHHVNIFLEHKEYSFDL